MTYAGALSTLTLVEWMMVTLGKLGHYPANTKCNKHVIITSNLCFDVIITCFLHCVLVGWLHNLVKSEWAANFPHCKTILDILPILVSPYTWIYQAVYQCVDSLVSVYNFIILCGFDLNFPKKLIMIWRWGTWSIFPCKRRSVNLCVCVFKQTLSIPIFTLVLLWSQDFVEVNNSCPVIHITAPAFIKLWFCARKYKRKLPQSVLIGECSEVCIRGFHAAILCDRNFSHWARGLHSANFTSTLLQGWVVTEWPLLVNSLAPSETDTHLTNMDHLEQD